MILDKNLDNFLEGQLRQINSDNMFNLEYEGLYDFITNEKIRSILSSLHANLVNLLRTMNERLPTGDNEAHFWADPSRDLMKTIDLTFNIKSNLRKSEFPVEIDAYYQNILDNCRIFLSSSGGSKLPPHMEKIILYYKLPIFTLTNSITTGVIGQNMPYELKLIGKGSYAHVYKYKDIFYNRAFVLKRANKDLTVKEINRFHREFEEMKTLSSPYIVEVYNYDSEKNEYIMEFMDCTLCKYIEEHQSSLTKEKRKSICRQILHAFKYINSKGILHRDISPHNILIKRYEDVDVIKIADFGLVKTPDSSLTSLYSELKGSCNDPALATEGFGNYVIQHEIYALTKIIYFVMTGKINTSNIKDAQMKQYVLKGLNPEKSKRFQNASEMQSALKEL